MNQQTLSIEHAALHGGIQHDDSPCDLAEARWLTAAKAKAGLAWVIPAGTLSEQSWLWYDSLLDGNKLVTFHLRLGDDAGSWFSLAFSMLNQAQARVRLSAARLSQNAWMLPREGAFLKPLCRGDVVDPAAVTRIELVVSGIPENETARWAMTSLHLTDTEPPLLTDPLLPKGPLLDELGQSTIHDWPMKTRSVEALADRLRCQKTEAEAARWPERWSRWGGWRDKPFESTGWFRTHHDGRRWWLVDPDGYAFWSNGPDCVRTGTPANIENLRHALSWHPTEDSGESFAECVGMAHGRPSINFTEACLIRVFGSDWRAEWESLTLAGLRQCGFNTIANWSDPDLARRSGLPYVMPLKKSNDNLTPRIFRDFPDVFHDQYEQEAARYAEQLHEWKDEQAMIGYFLMNEPTWGFAHLTPAAGMLVNTETCATRLAFARWLRERYPDDPALATAWGDGVSYARIERGRWHDRLNDQAKADCEAFSTVMVQQHYDLLSAACRKIDPHHLNLGARYYTVPPDWALKGMTSFDVFSINCYQDVPFADLMTHAEQVAGRPVMIGEWHFGALDVGLPQPCIRQVHTQADRGRAFRRYLEQAAAHPACIGAHWFQWIDQNALGRFDGEAYNTGMIDGCLRPYPPMYDAARLAAESLYDIADGNQAPTTEGPAPLPMLFLGG